MESLKDKKYEKKLISRGNNFPSIDMSKNNLDLICVLLHKRTPINHIQNALSITETQLSNRLERLVTEGLVKKEKGMFLPTFPVISEEEGIYFKKLCINIGNEIVNLILNHKEKIIEKTLELSVFNKFTFEEISFFILSGVLLDFIQIDNIEEYFLEVKRPSRNNKNYYYSIMEKNQHSKGESFGIYGNHCEDIGNVTLCMYGNERYSSLNLITLTKQQESDLFGTFSMDKAVSFKELLLEKIILNQIDKLPLDKDIQTGLEKFGIIKGDKLLVPILNECDYQSLYKVADIIKDGLIKILKCNRGNLLEEFAKTLYKDETTFEEYFIWYYHFLYTFVTDELIRLGAIKLPEARVFSYVLI